MGQIVSPLPEFTLGEVLTLGTPQNVAVVEDKILKEVIKVK